MDYVPFWSMNDGPFSKIELNIKILDLNIWTMALTVWHDISRAHRISSLLAVTRWGSGKRAELMSHPLVLLCGDSPFFFTYVLFVLYASLLFDEWISSSGTSCRVWVLRPLSAHSLSLWILSTHTHTHAHACNQPCKQPHIHAHN